MKLGFRCWPLAPLLAICLLSTGCRDSWLHRHMPFYTEPHVPGITTSWERIDELKKLAKEEPKKTPAEREAISDELAKEIQTAKDPLVRMHILKTLSVYPTAMAGRVLTAGMSDPEPSVRIVCCKAWGTCGSQRREGSARSKTRRRLCRWPTRSMKPTPPCSDDWSNR
jgi:hypothetical protein